jgi:hypothetical protein
MVFKPGQSGNPKGKPKGTLSKTAQQRVATASSMRAADPLRQRHKRGVGRGMPSIEPLPAVDFRPCRQRYKPPIRTAARR